MYFYTIDSIYIYKLKTNIFYFIQRELIMSLYNKSYDYITFIDYILLIIDNELLHRA